MAEVSFNFPSTAENYFLGSFGNIRLKFYYEAASGSSSDHAVDIYKLGKLNVQFEADPASQEFRFSYFDITFKADDVFFSSLFEDGKGKMFVELYRDNSSFFSGYISDNPGIKYEYDLNSGAPEPAEIKFRVFDALKYFWSTNKTLADYGFPHDADSSTLKQIFDSILADVHKGGIVYSQDAYISERCRLTYLIEEIRLSYLYGSNTLVSDFISKVIKILGLNIYNYKGNYILVSRIASTTETISSQNIEKLDRNVSLPVIKYLKIEAVKNWTDETHNHQQEITETFEAGDASLVQDDNEKLEILEEDILRYIYIYYKGSDSTATVESDPAEYGDDWLKADDSYIDFESEQIETGMVMYDDPINAPITIVHTIDQDFEDVIYFHVKTGYEYQGGSYKITRAPEGGTSKVLYKIYKLAEHLFNIYSENFLNVNTKTSFTIIGIDNITHLYSKFNVADISRYGRKFVFDMQNDMVKVFLY